MSLFSHRLGEAGRVPIEYYDRDRDPTNDTTARSLTRFRLFGFGPSSESLKLRVIIAARCMQLRAGNSRLESPPVRVRGDFLMGMFYFHGIPSTIELAHRANRQHQKPRHGSHIHIRYYYLVCIAVAHGGFVSNSMLLLLVMYSLREPVSPRVLHLRWPFKF